MKLPNLDYAVVATTKLETHLLNSGHPIGWGKAEFFARFGYRKTDLKRLAGDLIQHAMHNEVATVTETPFGTRYTVEGLLATPTGERPRLRSVWFMDKGTDVPRLISAYPLPRRPQ
jgi:hypothetical protein